MKQEISQLLFDYIKMRDRLMEQIKLIHAKIASWQYRADELHLLDEAKTKLAMVNIIIQELTDILNLSEP